MNDTMNNPFFKKLVFGGVWLSALNLNAVGGRTSPAFHARGQLGNRSGGPITMLPQPLQMQFEPYGIHWLTIER
jgi:hypothetical protein